MGRRFLKWRDWPQSFKMKLRCCGLAKKRRVRAGCCYECEAQIVRHVNACLHALKFGPRAGQAKLLAGSVGFLSAQLPLSQSGSQLTTNVRVMASEEPFNTVASMVADAVRMLFCGLCLPSVFLCCAWPQERRR